jgi:hypothetical protein
MKQQNKKHMVNNFKEAEEELLKIIKELEENPECSEGNMVGRLTHLYHHINFAWNIRNVESTDMIIACSEDDFIEWQQFPKDIAAWLSNNEDDWLSAEYQLKDND